MNNSSSGVSIDLMPFECDETFNATYGILEYVLTMAYLIPGVALHLWLLRCILMTQKTYFRESSFFHIFILDSIASVWLMLWDVFFARLFLYVSPLCPLVGPLFWSPSWLLKIYYCSTVHARLGKAVTQILMVLNRMSCVLMPTHYTQLWAKLTPLAVCLVIIVPFGGTWNLLISRMYLIPAYGGFGVNYVRVVQWAAISLFQSIYILTALAFTVTCTTVTLLKLLTMADRIKSAEKSLCFTSAYISFCFLLVAATQLTYVFCASCRAEDLLFVSQYLAFDLLNVGSGVIMLVSNTRLRESLFPSKRSSERVFRLTSTNNSFAHT